MISLELLGGCSVRTEDQLTVGEAGQARRSALLVLLASTRTGALSREKLIGFLWPETDGDRARHLLSESLYQLRRALGPDILLSEGEQIHLNADRVECDVTRFELAIERGDFEEAVARYGGPFLDGFYVRDAPEFERWVEAERQRFADAYAMALERLAQHADAAGDQVTAIRWWKRLVAHDPYGSRYVIGLMEALASADDPANALLVAEEHARLLHDELGVAPPDDLMACALRIRDDLSRSAAKVATTGLRVTDAAGEQGAPATSAPSGGQSREAGAWRSGWALLRSRRGAGVLIASAVLTVALIVLVRTGRGARETYQTGASTRVAILPFSYRGSDAFAYLGESMSHLLSTTLDGFGGLQAVAPLLDTDQAAEGRPAAEPDRVRDVSNRLAAQRVIAGDVVEVNGKLRVDVRLYRFSELAGTPRSAGTTGTVENFDVLADHLARQLLVMLVGPVREVHSVAARTTDSLSALKAYLEGVAHRRAGRFEAAFAAFQRAVEIDSTFALAWYGMGVAAAWETMPEWDPGMAASETAVRFSGSLPRHTQLVLRAYAAIMHGDAREAERFSRTVLSEYPGDVQAWFILAWAGSLNPFYGRPIEEIREAMERAYRYDPYDPDHQSGAAWFATREGDWTRFDSLWGDGFAARAVRAAGSGDPVAQRRVLAAAASADPVALSRASTWIAMTRRDLPAALPLAELAASRNSVPGAHALAYVWLAQLDWSLGRWQDATTALDEVARDHPAWAMLYRAIWASADFAPVKPDELERLRDEVARWDPTGVHPSVTSVGARAHEVLAPQLRLYALGRLLLRLGELDSALAVADALQHLGSPPSALSFAEDRAQGLRAGVAFHRHADAEALSALDAQPRRIRIQWLYGDTFFYSAPEDRFLRAEILKRAGREDEALRWYATIQDITPYDAHYLAMAHLRSAEICGHLGDPEQASRHLEEFLRLWQDADPELQPLVESARIAFTGTTAHLGRRVTR